jgi:hypothetical protein
METRAMDGPFQVNPDAFYDDDAVLLSLGLNPSRLAKARKAGELKATHRAGRPLYLGRWLVEWLTADAAPRERAMQGVPALAALMAKAKLAR